MRVATSAAAPLEGNSARDDVFIPVRMCALTASPQREKMRAYCHIMPADVHCSLD